MPHANPNKPPLWRLPFRAAALAWRGLPPGRIARFVASAALSVLIAAAYAQLFDWLDPHDYPPENGPLELGQAIVLAVTSLLLLVGIWRLRFEQRFFCALLGYALIFAILRETPRCVSEYYEGGLCIDTDWKPAIIALWTALFAFALWRRPLRLARRLEELSFFWVVPVALTGLLVVVSQVASSLVWVTTEETLELAAYLNLLFFAMALLRRPDRFEAPGGP